MVLLDWLGGLSSSREFVSSGRPHHAIVAVAVPRRQQAQPPGPQRPSDTIDAAVAVPATAIQVALIAMIAGAIVVIAAGVPLASPATTALEGG